MVRCNARDTLAHHSSPTPSSFFNLESWWSGGDGPSLRIYYLEPACSFGLPCCAARVNYACDIHPAAATPVSKRHDVPSGEGKKR